MEGEPSATTNYAFDFDVAVGSNHLVHTGMVKKISENESIIDSSLKYCNKNLAQIAPALTPWGLMQTKYTRNAWFFRGENFFDVFDDVVGTLLAVHNDQYFLPMNIVKGYLKQMNQTLQLDMNQECVTSRLTATVAKDVNELNNDFTVITPSHSDGPENIKSNIVSIKSCHKKLIAIAQAISTMQENHEVGNEFNMFKGDERLPYKRRLSIRHLFEKPTEDGCKELTLYTIFGYPSGTFIYKDLTPQDILLKAAESL